MDPIELVTKLENSGEKLIKGSEDLNRAIDHIIQLLSDAALLFKEKRYSTSVFISVTACEEISKAHIGFYSDGVNPDGKRKRNLLRDHKSKHLLAAMPTVPMSERLEKSIGKGEVKRIMNLAQNAGLFKVREDALYFQRIKDKIVIPQDLMDKSFARSILLFAIEVFDDHLVGYTNQSMALSDYTDTLFEEIKNA
jgi:AbiV family abortive infection protein